MTTIERLGRHKAEELKTRMNDLALHMPGPRHIYMGCSLEFSDEDLRNLVSTNDLPKSRTDQYCLMRANCHGLESWSRLMGFDVNGMTLERDWATKFFRGTFFNQPAYWIEHSAIQYIWVHIDSLKAAAELSRG